MTERLWHISAILTVLLPLQRVPLLQAQLHLSSVPGETVVQITWPANLIEADPVISSF